MGVVRFHGKALRFNGFTDGLVVPTGKYRESGVDLRANEFAGTVKATKSHATKIGRVHRDSKSHPLNSLRGSFTIDAYIVPDYGGVIVHKPNAFTLKYGKPHSEDKIVFEVHTEDRPYVISTPFDAPVKTNSNSGVYSSSSNAHRPQDMTLGAQGLVLVTAQYTQKEIRVFVNGDIVAEMNLGGDGGIMKETSSDLFIGGQGGEFRGLIESVRICQGVHPPSLSPLTKTDNTFGLWTFDDEQDVPEIYFFDHARSGSPQQGRDGPDTHDGLLDIPMVGIGYDFNTTHFKIRDYPANPGGATDRYTALEKLAALTQGIELEEVKDQSWYSSTLDLTDQTYFTGVNQTVLNAVINHSCTNPNTGVITPPDSQKVRFGDNSVLATSSTSTLNPSINRVERVRITGLDFANNRINCTSVILANDAANGTIDNFPETQGHLFAHTNNTPVWFTLGSADLLIDPGNNETSGSVSNQRKRRKDTFTLAQFVQGQRFTDMSGYSNDAYFVSLKSRSTASTDANTLYEPSTTYPAMGAATAYSMFEGDFFLRMLPPPDQQVVKQTVQGIANTFKYVSDEVSTQSLVSENQRVRVTETVYHGEISKVINKAKTVAGTDSASSSNNTFNRIVVESGIGYYDNSLSQNLYASTRDEIVAIAISDPKPFMLKGLDTEHTASFSNGVPTNDAYVRHLTPEKKTRVASIESPTVLVSAGGPKQILIHYDAIDLTGEVVGGTSLASGDVSAKFRADHATGNAAYLVVRKTIPCGSAVFGGRTVSDWLRRPYSGNNTSLTNILLTVTAPGGLVSLPTSTFNDKPASHILSSNPTGDITPSPFINIEDTVYGVGTEVQGYGRPKAVASINTPDDTSNSDYHVFYINSASLNNHKDHTSSKLTPSTLRRSNLAGFDVIDNELTGNENLVLVHPANRTRNSMLEDVSTASNSPLDTSLATLEKTLMRGRIEEITPTAGQEGESKTVINGRSVLMDILDHRSQRDFNLGQGSPVKEIGDLGTPTVSMTLGGLGQGGVDIQPVYTEHPFLPGWKDKIVGSGNASVRNDKQTSTYYASTRAVTELPLFPSMFFDVASLISADNDARTPLPADKNFKMTVDCTMATNRPEMRDNESRFAVDWGQRSPISSFEVTDQLEAWAEGNGRWLIRCQRPSVQAVVTSYNSGTLNVDDASAFLDSTGERGLQANCAANFFVTIGEGVLNDGYGIMARAAYNNGTSLTITTSQTWNPLNTTNNESSNLGNIDAGMTVTLGGYIILDGATSVSNDTQDYIISIEDISNFTARTPNLLADEIGTAVRTVIGLNANAVHADPNNSSRYFILDGPNMEAFEWDPNEDNESANDRQSLHPVICQTSYLSLKGKKSDGTALEYVRPLEIDFNNVANVKPDFNLCVEEVVRRINMAGHPQAKNSAGASAFNPPAIFPTSASNNDTGTHMGYVRAFIGTEVESRDGEAGISIVIHSTVPGASGRNFNVRLSNKTPYTYKPSQVVGYGGLLSSNSRLYQPNLIPSPMPIGADGETFVPISIFRGAPSGSTLDSTNALRSYNGLGSSFKVTTVAAPAQETLEGVASTVESSGVLFNESNISGNAQTTLTVDTVDATTKFRAGDTLFDDTGASIGTISAVTATLITLTANNSVAVNNNENLMRSIPMTDPRPTELVSQTSVSHLAISTSVEDYLKRLTRATGSLGKGILRVGTLIADFEFIDQQKVVAGNNGSVMTNCFFIRNITPRDTMIDFLEAFFDSDGASIGGIEVELIYPRTDAEGIVYFGGGHTGVTFDISDGTANDYSDDYPHHYSKGPTGFAGHQNLHEVSTASAVLDFTNITNNDTINDNTMQGVHHRLGTDGVNLQRCLLYARLNDGTITDGTYNQSPVITEALYGSKLRLTRGYGILTPDGNYSSGTSMDVTMTGSTDISDITIGSGSNLSGAMIVVHNDDAFTFTGTSATGGADATLTGVAGASAVNDGVEMTFARGDTVVATMTSLNGPAYSVDTTSKGYKFRGGQSIATHHWTGSATNLEYGPMSDFDITQDWSISAWFKPSDTSFANNNEICSGPIITGRDKNDRNWGLYLFGSRISNSDQTISFAMAYHDGSNHKIARNKVADGGIKITDNAWTNVIVTKSGTTISMRAGNSERLRGYNYSLSANQDTTSMINLGLGTFGSGNARSLETTTANHNNTATLPQFQGGVVKTGMCFIGVSTIKNLETVHSSGDSDALFTIHYTDVTGSTQGNHAGVCGTLDSHESYAGGGLAGTENVYFWNGSLSEVGVFNYALSESECEEIYAARGVW